MRSSSGRLENLPRDSIRVRFDVGSDSSSSAPPALKRLLFKGIVLLFLLRVFVR